MALMAVCCGQQHLCVFFGFLRTGEVVVPSQSQYDAEVHLSIDDVKLDSRIKPSYLMVQIKASKTDVFRKGVLCTLELQGLSYVRWQQ